MMHKTITIATRKKIALVAHDNRKEELLKWATDNLNLLGDHSLFATGTTGQLLKHRLGLNVTLLESGPLGGDQQIGSRISEGQIDFLIFFSDPLEVQPHDSDVKALLRIAVVWNIPVACNRASADFLISSPLMSTGYERIVPDYSNYRGRLLVGSHSKPAGRESAGAEMDADIVVIGRGIDGLSKAMQLLEQYPGPATWVLEKEARLANHQTGRTLARAADNEGTGALPWQESFTARLEALALLQTLNAELLSHDSATLTLERWCAAHRLASPAHVVAERVARAEQAPTDDQRQLLGVSATEPIRYRRVRLICGDHVLSEADNWYVAARLTPEMNRLLDTTGTAFGRAVQTLHFRRRTLSAKLLWSPLPHDWEMGAPLPERRGATLTIPHAVLEHRAVLALPDGTPFSEVIETYTREVLAFPGPQQR